MSQSSFGRFRPGSSADRARLATALRLRFGLPPSAPTDEQLDQVINDLAGRITRTDSVWATAVERYVPGFGSYSYASKDNSDLNEILDTILGK